MKYLLILLVVLSACKSGRIKQESQSQLPQTEIRHYGPDDIILFSKKKCRGTCQVFDLRIQGNGMAELTAIENMPVSGRFVRSLRPDEVASLFEQSEAAVVDMGDRYYPNVSDYQESVFQLTTSRISKTIEGRHKAPDGYVVLLKRLEAISTGEGWTMVQD